MLKDILKRAMTNWFWQKHIKFCREHADFWVTVEKNAIAHGVDHKKIVFVRCFRQSYEEALATLRNPDKTDEDMEKCVIKLKACLEREKRFHQALRSKDFELADKIIDSQFNQS